uniref:DZF domain-containing protein n=1 Tax=Ascaris lumbricoides TaxID=6252 RepID=A0A0M3IUM7_ASCLU
MQPPSCEFNQTAPYNCLHSRSTSRNILTLGVAQALLNLIQLPSAKYARWDGLFENLLSKKKPLVGAARQVEFAEMVDDSSRLAATLEEIQTILRELIFLELFRKVQLAKLAEFD